MAVWRMSLYLAAASWLCLGAGCGGDSGEFKTAEEIKQEKPVDPHAHAHDHDHGHDDHGHHHVAPHSGSLTMLGDHEAQFELLLDEESGKLTLFVLDGAAVNPVPVEDTELQLATTIPGEKAGESQIKTLTLTPVEAGKSEMGFAGQDDALKQAAQFTAVLESVTAGGKTYEKVKLNYTDPHDHKHDEHAHGDKAHGDEAHADPKPE